MFDDGRDPLRHRFADREGFAPRFVATNAAGDEWVRAAAKTEDQLRQEHDHLLLIFSQNEQLRNAARAAALRIGEHAYLADRGVPGAAREHVLSNTAKALAGDDFDRHAVGYLQYELAFEVMARLAK